MQNKIFSADYDNTWKEMLRDFFYPMIKSALPDLYAELDLSKPPVFLDKEANDLTRKLSENVSNTIREVDLLADLPLKTKVRDSVKILLHCEVQGRGGKEDLSFRMYCYKNLLELRYKKPIVALAVITEPLPKNQMLGEYRWSVFGTESMYRFNVLKVFEASEDLQESDNPFDMAQLAAARAWRARNSEISRLEYLKEFIRLLSEKGWKHEEKFKIMKFLETMAKIRETDLKQNYLEFVDGAKQKKGEKVMLMIEERAIKLGRAEGVAKGRAKGRTEGRTEGRAEGRTEGKIETARKLLAMGFDFEIISQATGLTESQLRA